MQVAVNPKEAADLVEGEVLDHREEHVLVGISEECLSVDLLCDLRVARPDVLHK